MMNVSLISSTKLDACFSLCIVGLLSKQVATFPYTSTQITVNMSYVLECIHTANVVNQFFR